MFGKRQAHGNVAIAALLFVTAIGVGAVALDSTRIAQGSRSQVAQTPAATKTRAANTPSKDTVKGKCEIGFDYEIRETKGAPEIKQRGPSQCVKTNDTTTKYTYQATKIRYCSKEGWRCQYFYCKIDELRRKNSKGMATDSECVLIGQEGKPGEDVDLSSGRTQALSGAIKDVLTNPYSSVEQKKAAAEYSQALDTNVQTQILSAFKTETDIPAQTKILDDLKKENTAAASLAGWCRANDPTGASCSALDEDAKRTQEAYDAQKAKLESLAKDSQKLAEVKKVLESDTQPGVQPPGNCPGGTNCTAVDPPKTKTDTFTLPPSPGNTTGGTVSNGFGGGDLLKTLGQALPLLNSLSNLFGGSSNAPTCTLRVSPTNITSPGQTVTLSWTTTNAQSAYLSNVGQVGPSGSIQVQPQGATTYSMQVTGYPQQQQSSQQQGQFVYNPYTSQYQYVPAQQQPYSQGAAQQGQCQVQITMGQGGGSDTSVKPKAQISCQPKIADVGMQASISYSCQNANTSSGEGFSTNGQLSGSASTTVASPILGSTSLTYGVTCSKDGVTDSAQCTVNVNKPSIVLVANPRDIDEGEKTTIGWVTGAMDKCVISSPTLSDFTEENKDNTSVSGSVRTPALTRDTKFVLTCVTKAGSTKSAETTVRVDD